MKNRSLPVILTAALAGLAAQSALAQTPKATTATGAC
jgi:hypothetical protein